MGPMTTSTWQQASPVRKSRNYLADGGTAGALDDWEAPPPDVAPPDVINGLQAQGIDPMTGQPVPTPGSGEVPVEGTNLPTDYSGVGTSSATDDQAAIPLWRKIFGSQQSPPANVAPTDMAGASAALKAALATAPVKSNPTWWERLAAAGAGGAAGWSNAASRTKHPIDIGAVQENILHPGYQDKLSQWQSRVAPAEAQLQLAGQQVAAQQAAEKNTATNEELKARADYYRGQGRTSVTVTPDLERVSGGVLQAGTVVPATWATTVLDDKRTRNETEKPVVVNGALVNPKTGAVIYNGGPKTPTETAEERLWETNAQVMAQQHPELQIDTTKPVLPQLPATLRQQAMTASKSEPAAAAKQAFQATIAKIADTLPPTAMTDVNALSRAIRSSNVLLPKEKNDALAYLTANPSPATAGTTATIRMEGLGNTREYPVINTRTKQMEMRSASDINSNPGLYAPASGGATAMGKEAVFQDLHYNINTARNAIAALPSMDVGTRAALSYALRHTDPASAIQTFLAGQVGQNLSPEQQEAVQSLALLSENALALRGVAGMGQGSDDLRAAIQATIPSGKSPSKDYAQKQLDKFESVVTRLEGGVPRVGPPAAVVQGAGGKAIDLSRFYK